MFPHDEVITIKYKHGYLRPILKNKLFPMTRNNRTQKKFQHVLQLQGELFSHVLLLVTVVTTAGNAQAKKFNEDIYWKMVENKSLQLLNNELLNLHIVANEEPIFTACGLFSFDNSLICSVISQITTYLVIILQVAKSSGTTVEPPMNAKSS
ncbi:unnamed protein product [Nezara viridula]|uniref:Gustatory receptor n=1 Tax=Nezara viridula TaxID=85310 RepID=A0A9P0H781_NEZVI|nr:unnamed protein product [Nezara viridula]